MDKHRKLRFACCICDNTVFERPRVYSSSSHHGLLRLTANRGRDGRYLVCAKCNRACSQGIVLPLRSHLSFPAHSTQLGLFATRPYEKGEVVAKYHGKICYGPDYRKDEEVDWTYALAHNWYEVIDAKNSRCEEGIFRLFDSLDLICCCACLLCSSLRISFVVVCASMLTTQ